MSLFFKQCLFIMVLSLIAEIGSFYLRSFIFIPAPLLGIILVTFLLQTKLVKTNYIEALAQNWLKNIPLLFIPLGVYWMNIPATSMIKSHFVNFIFFMTMICLLSLGITGLLTQLILKLFKRR